MTLKLRQRQNEKTITWEDVLNLVKDADID